MTNQTPIDSLLRPSVLHLPRGNWTTVLDCLCAHFSAIERAQWLDRFARGRVLDERGVAIDAQHRYREGLRIYYFREVDNEQPIAARETVLHLDEHLLVVDKPHFLPVQPAGQYVQETLLTRLVQRFVNPDLVPLHRIDRETAGLVLFSTQRASRAAYQALFREHKITKRYEALAPALPNIVFPLYRETRLAVGEPFFRMREIVGAANSKTLIDVIDRRGANWHYALTPITGKKHQLRVHMAALGAPICNDTLYPQLHEQRVDDYARPLQLLARSLAFRDPLSGEQRLFESLLALRIQLALRCRKA